MVFASILQCHARMRENVEEKNLVKFLELQNLIIPIITAQNQEETN